MGNIQEKIVEKKIVVSGLHKCLGGFCPICGKAGFVVSIEDDTYCCFSCNINGGVEDYDEFVSQKPEDVDLTIKRFLIHMKKRVIVINK